MKTVCVFCSSSKDVSEEIKAAGALLGQRLAESGLALLYGGTSCGLMQILADAHKACGGYLIGVIPTYMQQQGRYYSSLDEVYFVEDLGPRKQQMLQKSDFIVAMPGGIGTYDEFIDLLSLKMINRHCKPMYLLNTNNFFEPLLNLFKHGIKHKTIQPDCLKVFEVYDTVDELVKAINSCL